MANAIPTTVPYDDTAMKYDYDEHRYYLTAKGVLEKIGVNLDLSLNVAISGNPFAVNNFLKDTADTVYDYIYENNANEELIEYLLAMYYPLRHEIEKMLLAQVKYCLSNGILDMYSGVNIPKGTAMKPSDLRSAVRVAPQVERACLRNLAGLDFCLKTALFLPQLPQSAFRNGY